MTRAFALVVAMVATPATAADQFDLVCQHEKGATRYRVDLAKNEACSDTCDRVWKMGPATTGELKLIDQVPAYRGDLEELATVNRITGEYRYRSQFSNLRATHREGRCEVTGFSGFPAAKF